MQEELQPIQTTVNILYRNITTPPYLIGGWVVIKILKLNAKSGLPIDTERVHLAYLKRLIFSLDISA